jgi:hypothetical protein
VPSNDLNDDGIREGEPPFTRPAAAPSPGSDDDGNREPDIAKAHPGFRMLAGFASLGFLALAVVSFFSFSGEERQLITLVGALLCATYSAKFAATGQGRPWP